MILVVGGEHWGLRFCCDKECSWPGTCQADKEACGKQVAVTEAGGMEEGMGDKVPGPGPGPGPGALSVVSCPRETGRPRGQG